MNKWILVFLSVVFFCGCSEFDPFSTKVSSTSDGAYVVQSSASDSQLMQSGYAVVYRFQSIPNLIAVKRIDVGNQGLLPLSLSSDANALLQENARNHFFESPTKSQMNLPDSNCYRAYCEAQFDLALSDVSVQHIPLSAVPVAIVDSGVIPATNPIANALASKINVSGNTDPKTWPTHATMIASLLAGVMDRRTTYPIDVYAPNAKINSVKITFTGDPEEEHKQYGSMQLAVALDKAVMTGAKIINLSLTYDAKPDDNIIMAEELIMAAGAKKGVLFVAAAGNDGKNLDVSPVYPAAYDANNLIVVGSHNEFLNRTHSSNYGNTVDLSAQGAFIYVNDKHGNLVASGGTSFAAPLVVSALSLYFGINPNAKIEDAMLDLFSSTAPTQDDEQSNKFTRYGRLNVKSFLQKAVTKKIF